MSSNRKLFSRDSTFFYYTEKFANLMILNLLVIVFSIPMFSFGASITALYSVLSKMCKDEEGIVFVDFWRAFRENFKRATCIWVCFFVIGAFLLWDYYLLRTGVLPEVNYLKWPVFIIAFIAFCCAMWSFILQSRYVNNVFSTIRNGLLFSIFYFPATLLMALAVAVPVFLLIISFSLMPIVLVCGISGPALLQTILFGRIFSGIEPTPNEEEQV